MYHQAVVFDETVFPFAQDKVESAVNIPSRSRVIPVLHGLHEDGNTPVHPHNTELGNHQASEDSVNGLDSTSLHDEAQQQDQSTSAPHISATHEDQLSGGSSVSQYLANKMVLIDQMVLQHLI
ncbi:hypothetical protein V6N12_019536 [Hibiscus sabdariffa]|uniref:Uncharacterized protein n=1 Tax=Hibiscus sabdariffa TaxID=183260 RepID=A0ABR2BPB2_9ROSI